MASDIAEEVQFYENPPPLRRDALTRKINRILQRGTTKDKPRCDAPRTVRTKQMKKTVKRLIHLARGQSQREVVSDLKCNNMKVERTSVRRIIKELN